MSQLFDILFYPPPMPPIDLPVPARLIPGIKATVMQAFELAYHRGCFDGFVAGVLVTLLFVPSIRDRVYSEVSHVAKRF